MTSVQQHCPRCQGRLLEQGDRYGRYLSCWACGYVDECWHGPALDLVEPLSGQRKREPSHGHVTL